jgi:hypothetical protein
LCVPASSSVVLLGCIAWLIQPFVASGNSRFVGFCYDGPLSDSEAGLAESASVSLLPGGAGAALAQEAGPQSRPRSTQASWRPVHLFDHKSVSVFETPKRHDRSSGQENKANPAQNLAALRQKPHQNVGGHRQRRVSSC